MHVQEHGEGEAGYYTTRDLTVSKTMSLIWLNNYLLERTR